MLCVLGLVLFCAIMSEPNYAGFYEMLAVSNLFTLSVYVCICLLALKNDLLL